MGSAAKQSYGAVGRWDGLWFEPETLVVVKDPNHPLFDERSALSFDEALVQVILTNNGIDDPILINKNGEIDGKPNNEIVDGRQRVAAYIEANKRLVKQGQPPLRIKGIPIRGEVAYLMETMISSNENRKADNILVKAKKASRLLRAGRTAKQAGVTFGVSEVTIRNWVALLDTAPEVQKQVESGKLAAAAALELRTLPRDAQIAKLKEVASQSTSPEAAPTAKAVKKSLKTGRPGGRVRSRKQIEDLKVLLNEDILVLLSPTSILDWVLGGNDSKIEKLLTKK